MESCGIAAYHIGELPDPRTRAAAKKYDIILNSRARQFQSRDFQDFDYIFALDQSVYNSLTKKAPSPEAAQKIELFRRYDPLHPAQSDVPDPYYGSMRDFEEVQAMVLRTAKALLDSLIQKHPQLSAE